MLPRNRSATVLKVSRSTCQAAAAGLRHTRALVLGFKARIFREFSPRPSPIRWERENTSPLVQVSGVGGCRTHLGRLENDRLLSPLPTDVSTSEHGQLALAHAAGEPRYVGDVPRARPALRTRRKPSKRFFPHIHPHPAEANEMGLAALPQHLRGANTPLRRDGPVEARRGIAGGEIKHVHRHVGDDHAGQERPGA